MKRATSPWERRRLAGVALLMMLGVELIASSARAADPTPAQLQFFENRIRPVLAENCYKCHSDQAEKIKGGLLLDGRDSVLKGGDTGPAIVPGDPEHSLLIKAVRYKDPDLQMPPKGKQLPEKTIADLVTWVKMGAPDPRAATVAQKARTESSKTHWAWQPLTKPGLPAVQDHTWAKTPVDNFILAKLEARGLTFSAEAPPHVLVRRVYLDLIGLPPTPDEMQAFLADRSSNAPFAGSISRRISPQRSIARALIRMTCLSSCRRCARRGADLAGLALGIDVERLSARAGNLKGAPS
jgi:mono/diheme cytochrome c family protein